MQLSFLFCFFKSPHTTLGEKLRLGGGGGGGGWGGKFEGDQDVSRFRCP